MITCLTLQEHDDDDDDLNVFQKRFNPPPHNLCMCAIWTVTLGEKRRLRVFQNRLLRKIFGPKGDDVTGDKQIA